MKKLYLLALLFIITPSALAAYCYQESANISTECGGLNTGSYWGNLTTFDSYNLPNLTDGNWNTYGYGSFLSGPGFLYVNYTKPGGAKNDSLLQYKHSQNNLTNLSIPSSCWSQQQLQFQIDTRTGMTTESNNLSCYNGTGWAVISYVGGASELNNARVYEEAMWWNITRPVINTTRITALPYRNETAMGYCNATDENNNTINYEYQWLKNSVFNMSGITSNFTVGIDANVANLSLQAFSVYDNVTLSCRAYDGEGYSSWMNSSSVMIQNYAPSIPLLSLNASIKVGEVLVASVTNSTDAENDSLTYYVEVFNVNDTNTTSAYGTTSTYAIAVTDAHDLLRVRAKVWDGYNYSIVNESNISVSNTAPVLDSVTLSPLPTQAGQDINVSHTCSDADGDTCNTTIYYAWFKNGVSLNINNIVLKSGNFTTGDNITGSVIVNDGLENSTPLNSSTALIGDTTAPVITSFTVSPSSLTTDQTTTFTINCTDNAVVATAYAEVTDPGLIKFNYTMSGSNLRAYTYDPGVAGTYTVKPYCIDSNGLTTTGNTSAFTVSNPPDAGGSGGGSVEVTPAGTCGFRTITPAPGSGASNPFCPVGGSSTDLKVSLFNLASSTKKFSLYVPGERCTSDDILIAGNSKGDLFLKECQCPSQRSTTDTFTVVIRQEGCPDTQSFQTSLTARSIIPQNPGGLVIFAGAVVGLLFLAVVVLFLLTKKRR